MKTCRSDALMRFSIRTKCPFETIFPLFDYSGTFQKPYTKTWSYTNIYSVLSRATATPPRACRGGLAVAPFRRAYRTASERSRTRGNFSSTRFQVAAVQAANTPYPSTASPARVFVFRSRLMLTSYPQVIHKYFLFLKCL